MSEIRIIVPCHNEAERLEPECFSRFAASHPSIRFLFVNDGSTDATLEVLRRLEQRDPARFSLVDQQPNRGKAEAIRAGIRAALEMDPDYVGYWDADLATPLAEISNFGEILDAQPDCAMVMGSRVQMLGRSIDRHSTRHYLGRLFATAASLALGVPVYDTQCGAKLLRVNERTRRLFDEPFCVGWTFDVELIARLMHASELGRNTPTGKLVIESPLMQWRDVPGSKVRPIDFFRSFGELLRIYRRYA